jgi:hypothetical protein
MFNSGGYLLWLPDEVRGTPESRDILMPRLTMLIMMFNSGGYLLWLPDGVRGTSGSRDILMPRDRESGYFILYVIVRRVCAIKPAAANRASGQPPWRVLDLFRVSSALTTLAFRTYRGLRCYRCPDWDSFRLCVQLVRAAEIPPQRSPWAIHHNRESSLTLLDPRAFRVGEYAACRRSPSA